MRLDGSLYDPYGGREYIERKCLRATSEAFGEDPLRVLRGMQFAARFGFEAEERTIEMCRCLLPEFETLPAERLWVEWRKWATKGRFPSEGLQFLKDCGWIEKFPEVTALVGCEQNPLWHPEGDVFIHTQCVCDEASKIADEMGLSEDERLEVLLGGLCHDFGKPATTVLNENNHLTAPGHDAAGKEPTLSFLNRLKAPNWIVERVVPLVLEHMAHMVVPEGRSQANDWFDVWQLDWPRRRSECGMLFVRRTVVVAAVCVTEAVGCLAGWKSRNGYRFQRRSPSRFCEVAI